MSYADIIPCPVSGDVIARPTGTTAARYEVPTKWHGRKVDFTAIDQDIEILFGGATVAVTWKQASTVSTEALTAHAASGARIPAGQTRVFDIVRGVTHFSVVSGTSGGAFEAHPSGDR